MQIYGHPWSTNTRKALMALAEKGHEASFKLVMLPKGEQKLPEHIALHPFGKVPVLDDDGFVLYETRAINAYLDRKLSGPSLTPSAERDLARFDQWTNVADAYFAPHAMPVIMELLFRKYLGGEKNVAAIEAGRAGVGTALDALDRWLGSNSYVAGATFSLADIHWMPYLEYFTQIGEGEAVAKRKHLAAWWERVSSRPTWQRVARTGPQPYESGVVDADIEKQARK
jgi:glutathione S-transferase